MQKKINYSSPFLHLHQLHTQISSQSHYYFWFSHLSSPWGKGEALPSFHQPFTDLWRSRGTEALGRDLGAVSPPRSVTPWKNPESGSARSTPPRRPHAPTTQPLVTSVVQRPKPTSKSTALLPLLSNRSIIGTRSIPLWTTGYTPESRRLLSSVGRRVAPWAAPLSRVAEWDQLLLRWRNRYLRPRDIRGLRRSLRRIAAATAILRRRLLTTETT